MTAIAEEGGSEQVFYDHGGAQREYRDMSDDDDGDDANDDHPEDHRDLSQTIAPSRSYLRSQPQTMPSEGVGEQG